MRAFWAPNPGEGLHPRAAVPAVGGTLPHLGRPPPHSSVTPCTAPGPGRHRAGVAVQRRLPREEPGQFLGVHVRRSSPRPGSHPGAPASASGPLKAHSRGTCWSRTIPISRASGSLVSKASASGSPVRCRLRRAMARVYGRRPGSGPGLPSHDVKMSTTRPARARTTGAPDDRARHLRLRPAHEDPGQARGQDSAGASGRAAADGQRHGAVQRLAGGEGDQGGRHDVVRLRLRRPGRRQPARRPSAPTARSSWSRGSPRPSSSWSCSR